MEVAGSIGGTGWPGRTLGTCIMANKYMAFKDGQAESLLLQE
jgi:hypothetical protein